MNESISRRSLLGATFAAGAAAVALRPVSAAEVAKSQVTEESLGTLLKSMGLEAKLTEKRYDFNFKSNVNSEEWELSMSAVLSQDGSSLWMMAWLDELPKSAADVPRTALLRLLSDNDKLGKGKFFAYIASNRRFVMQRVLPNEGISGATFRAALDDLGATVVGTHPHWSVAGWNSAQPGSAEDPAQAARSGMQVKGSAPNAAAPRAAQSAGNDSKFNSTGKQ